MFKDARAGLMHAGIFWGFVLLTIGTANVVTGGIIEQVLSIPFDGLLWALISAMQNVVAVIVLVSIAWAFYRRLVTKPRRLTFNRDALVILAMIGGVVATELLAEAFEFAALRRPARGVRVRGAGRPAAVGVLAGGARGGLRHPVVGAHRPGRGVPVLPAVLQAPPHRHELPEHLVPQARPARRAAEDGPRGRERHVRAQDAPGSRLEGPPRRVHLHRMRPLPGGVPGPCHREAAQSQDLHHGHPRHVGRRRGRDRPHPELADRARDLRPRRHAARRHGAGRAHRRHGDPLRRGLGLRHVRGVRRGLPGAHRARRQDRRAAAQPGPRGVALPAGADARVPGHGGPGQPVGPARLGPPRLDEAAAVRGPDGRVGRRGRRARRARGPVLGRLRGGVRSTQPEGRQGGGDLPACRRCLVRGARPGGVVHRRPGSADGQRLRVPDPRRWRRRDAEPVRDGGADDRDGLPALLQHDRQRVRAARRGVPDRPPLAVPGRARVVRAPGDRCRRTRPRRPATTGRAA